MSCAQLHQLLKADPTMTYDEQTERLADHLRSCSHCHQGIIRLSQALIVHDTLSCEQCRHLLPSYYEAIQPVFPLVQMNEQEIRSVVIHLSHCASCQSDFRFLVEVDKIEEAELEIEAE